MNKKIKNILLIIWVGFCFEAAAQEAAQAEQAKSTQTQAATETTAAPVEEQGFSADDVVIPVAPAPVAAPAAETALPAPVAAPTAETALPAPVAAPATVLAPATQTPTAVPKPVAPQIAMPEDLASSMISVSRIRRLPANFTDVNTLCWNATGTRLLVDRFRRRSYEVAEIDVPAVFSDTKLLPERILCDSVRDGQSLHYGNVCLLPGAGPQFLFTKQNAASRDYMASMPQNGWYCNLFVGLGQRQAVPLTQFMYSPTVPVGVSSPSASADGKTVFWCGVKGRGKDKSIWGERGLYIGNLVWNNRVPRLANITEISDGRIGSFRESCAISPDGSNVMYCANRNNVPWFVMDLYVRNLKGNTIKCLAEGGWNRWGSYSPKGKKIIWSSSRGFSLPNMGLGGNRWQQELRSELWVMTADGIDKKRLTYFNQRDARDNLFLGLRPQDHCYVGASAWNPNGRQVAVVIHFGARKKPTSMVVLMDLSDRMAK